MTILVGLVDSGISGAVAAHVAAAERFDPAEGGVTRGAILPDKMRHGSVLAEIIMSVAPQAKLLNAQVFGRSAATSPEAIAAALAWTVNQGARIVNLSVGLAHDRLVLRQACRMAVERNVILLASSPARGAPVFPASYQGVLRISGDARCAPGEISALQNVQADFGAHPRGPGMMEGVAGGSSYSAAWVTGLIAAFLEPAPGAGRDEIISYLMATSRYHGAECRLS